ncbi:MAG: serine hydrolase, partial [Pseudomonadota bacterium]
MRTMTGSPPTAADQVDLSNWRTAPYCRWAFNHVREIVPSAPILRDRSHCRRLREAPAGLLDVVFTDAKGEQLDAAAWVARDAIDALTVLRDDALLLEWYATGQAPQLPHILMSVSLSVLGLLTGAVLDQAGVSADTQLVQVLPELKGSAWQGATIRDALDMRVSIQFDEDYLATDGAIVAYRKAQGWNPLAAGESTSDLRSFLPTLAQADGGHGGPFHYVSPNTDLLAWALERISGQRYSELLSERLWQPIGAEEDGYITVDRLGAARAAGGVCVTARAVARRGVFL